MGKAKKKQETRKIKKFKHILCGAEEPTNCTPHTCGKSLYHNGKHGECTQSNNCQAEW